MSKITFTQETTNLWNKEEVTRVIVETTAADIDAILEQFEYFLKGCGFHFEGHVDIVPNYDDGPIPHQEFYVPEPSCSTGGGCCGGCDIDIKTTL